MTTEKILLLDTNIPGNTMRVAKNKAAPLMPGFTRPGTYVRPYKFHYVLYGGGFGDYCCYTRAFEWIYENCPHVAPVFYYPKFMTDFAYYFFGDRRRCSIENNEQCVADDWDPKSPFIAPYRAGVTQFISPQGAHPLRLGFAYYSNQIDIPDGYDNYPEIDLSDDGLPKELKTLSYAVIAPGAVRKTGTVPGRFWNPIIKFLNSNGVTPVILGKSSMTNGYHAKLPEGIEADSTINLWDQTPMALDAARIIQYAKVVIGLDNGLLHLAGCTKAPIVFGHNVANIKLRRPIRKVGKIVDVFIPREELGCTFCLTDIKCHYMWEFNNNCLYEHVDKLPHPKCIDMLFEDNGRRWKNAIDEALEQPTTEGK